MKRSVDGVDQLVAQLASYSFYINFVTFIGQPYCQNREALPWGETFGQVADLESACSRPLSCCAISPVQPVLWVLLTRQVRLRSEPHVDIGQTSVTRGTVNYMNNAVCTPSQILSGSGIRRMEADERDLKAYFRTPLLQCAFMSTKDV